MPALTSAPDPLSTDEPSLAALASQAIEEARALAGAEVALVKARIGERVAAYRGAIVFFAVAAILALSALVALLVGLILTLATLVGPGLATAAVVIGTLAIAAVLGVLGKGRLAPPKMIDR